MSYNKKRFKFPMNCRMVRVDYPIDESKVVHTGKLYKVIHKDNFVAGVYANYRLSKNTNKSKIMTTERILALKPMKGIICSTEQLEELQEMCDLYNDGEYFGFCSASMVNMLRSGISKNLVRRQRIKINVKSVDSRFSFFLMYNSNWREIWKEKKCDNFKGDKNPAYQHGGKCSALSRNFVGYVGMNEEEITNAINLVSGKISVANTNTTKSPSSYTYYMVHHNMSEKDARKASFEFVSSISFSKDNCIKKYGLEEGLRIFNARQVNWQNTMKSKTQEEIDDINLRKNSGYTLLKDNTKTAILYYLRFYSTKEDMEFFKIGYTTKTIHKRFPKMQLKKSYLDYEVIYSAEGTMLEMINKEQHLLRKFHKHRFKCSYNGFATTEAFSDNVLSINEIETAPTSGVVSTLRYRKNKITLKNDTLTLENRSIRVVENAFEDWL